MHNAALHPHCRVKVGKQLRAAVYRVYGDDCHLCGHRIPYGQRSVTTENRAGGGSTI